MYSKKEIKKQYKIIFTDLDDTLIKTYTGETFPKGVWDMQIKFDVLDKIKELKPKYFFIVTNQGGIGEYVNREYFERKLAYLNAAIFEYIGDNGLIVYSTYCSSKDKTDPRRKPNTQMAFDCIQVLNLKSGEDFKNSDCLMIGDASGYPGDFSTSDKDFADNLGIDYVDVRDLLEEI